MTRNTGMQENFTYWKRPWHSWMVLVAGILQLLCLWMNVREYGNVSGAGVLSDLEWERYAAQKGLQCAFNALGVAAFLGIFLIGTWARSKRSARLAEGLFLLVLAFAWGIAGIVLPLAAPDGNRIVWAFVLLLALGGGIYSLWTNRNR